MRREWGMGSGEWEEGAYFPLPTPYSPLPISYDL